LVLRPAWLSSGRRVHQARCRRSRPRPPLVGRACSATSGRRLLGMSLSAHCMSSAAVESISSLVKVVAALRKAPSAAVCLARLALSSVATLASARRRLRLFKVRSRCCSRRPSRLQKSPCSQSNMRCATSVCADMPRGSGPIISFVRTSSKRVHASLPSAIRFQHCRVSCRMRRRMLKGMCKRELCERR
jgi:hypothetical protein